MTGATRPRRKPATPDPEYQAAVKARKTAAVKAAAEGKPMPPTIKRNPKTREITESKRTREQIAKETAEKAERAARLRIQRYDWATIAKKVGYADKSSAYQAVQRYIAQIPMEAVNELRQLELESLDQAEAALQERIALGDEKAVNAMLNIKTQRAKLTGLYEANVGPGDEGLLRVQVATEVARLMKAHPDMNIADVINEVTKRSGA